MYFDKYEKKGAYHWESYHNKRSTYRAHAQRVLSWVREGKTLDVGAGDGLITFLLKAQGVDDNELAVSMAVERGASVEVGSAYDLSRYMGFDNILLLDVIEHLEEPEKALYEVKKVLGGGWLYITTPHKRESGILNDSHHIQEWSKDGLVAFVERNGFQCIDVSVWKSKRIYAVFTVEDEK